MAVKITITEALQEIKTIGKRITKKREGVVPYIIRDQRARDPLEKDGGSEKFIREEFQSIGDLSERVIKIRMAIQQANFSNALTIEGTTRSVAEWLTWRREISPGIQSFNNQLLNSIKSFKAETTRKGGRVIGAQVQVNENYKPDDPPTLVVNIDELATVRQQEEMEKILGDLDGKLSLFNATCTIEL